MNDPDLTPDEERQARAAEYVLGLMTLEEASIFEANMRADPTLATLVRNWNSRFAPIATSLEPVSAQAAVWDEIEDSLFGKPEVARGPGWRWLLAGAFAAGLGAAVFFNAPALTPPSHQLALVTEAFSPVPGLQIDLDVRDAQRRLVTNPIAGEKPFGRDVELWVIVADAPPQSLGVLNLTRSQSFVIPTIVDPTLVTFAISDEPLGGSPTGTPTGPILAAVPLEG
mgnify:CR=1 FL=1